MPIKLPKGFQRRKSSGNALDEINTPPTSSFRVIERPGNSKSFDGSIMMRSAGAGPPPSLMARNSFANDEEDLFSVARPDASNRYDIYHIDPVVTQSAKSNRGSGGTENSTVSAGDFNSGASSTRLSTSTNPSSLDSRSDRNVQTFKDIPVPPPPSARPGFLRNSTRTFSLGLGIKSAKEAHVATPERPPVPTIHPSNESTRSRAMTASSASTATPPKLFDSDLALDNTELDGFGNMFDGIGARSNREDLPSSSLGHYPPTSFPGVAPIRVSRAPAPRPIRTNQYDAVESSSYSWTSPGSQDGLMRSPSPSRTITQNSPSRPFAAPVPGSPSNPAATPLPQSRKPVVRTQTNTAYDDTPPPVPSHSNVNGSVHLKTTVSTISDGRASELDPALLASAELAARFEEAKPSAPRLAPNHKVMTPAQFEQYKRQQEMDRRLGASADSDSDDGDHYDDDDHGEKEKQATKQRKKQEAHLAVYRQQMMKVTGEQSAMRSTSSFSNALRTSPTPDLDNRLSHLTVSTKHSGKSSGGEEEEEDEDVPLGILAAHGFPSRNRPPTQLSQSSSNPNLRALSQSQGAAESVAGDAAKRGSLPVFARHLPQDPYYGASLVNQANRESMSMHGSYSPQMTPSGAATAHPHHPAGLVGVIAGEEKARAMRRGSPNPQGGYDLPPSMQHPGMVRSSTTGMIPGMPGLSPGDHAQIQMSQQMTQMMQMQMQWMQQMQQMMGGQVNGGQSMPPMSPQMMPPGMLQGMPPNFLAPSEQMSRPQSIQMHSSPASGLRTMSTLSPSMANWNAVSNNNYAHSIAPSERSNVGLASRYRPVSTIQDPEILNRRSSTFTSSSFRPWSTVDASPKPPAHGTKSSISPMGRKSPLAQHDEDDDEEGWAEMKAKKEKKQKTWKLRKGQNALQELYNGAS